MKKRLITITLLSSLLTGCMVGPKYNRPKVQPPDTFRGTATPSPVADPTSLADLKWFEVFKDERLQELVRTALTQNYDLREAVVRVDAARANLGITRADQFPTIGAGASITTQRNSANGSFAFPAGTNRDRTFGSVMLSLL
jgi:outer membrane protein, multidrug efflux system